MLLKMLSPFEETNEFLLETIYLVVSYTFSTHSSFIVQYLNKIRYSFIFFFFFLLKIYKSVLSTNIMGI